MSPADQDRYKESYATCKALDAASDYVAIQEYLQDAERMYGIASAAHRGCIDGETLLPLPGSGLSP